ncbi:hypothetical protein MANES_16G044551v8 [Manihot esculenta]|uniref:Uncharacterized protein n=1 Tax=Manihot esculenta TaxID=3983 RepID=A0ACB7G5H7_MANES|nr:hypothetical protein MANES_16G044551v8 [Manihot esculenta]
MALSLRATLLFSSSLHSLLGFCSWFPSITLVGKKGPFSTISHKSTPSDLRK